MRPANAEDHEIEWEQEQGSRRWNRSLNVRKITLISVKNSTVTKIRLEVNGTLVTRADRTTGYRRHRRRTGGGILPSDLPMSVKLTAYIPTY